MKSISIPGLLLVIAAGTVPAPAAPEPDTTTDNPYAQFDPDGVPLVVTQPNLRRRGGPTPQDMEAAHQREVAAVVDSNWLLRGYEEQLRLHNERTPAQLSTDLYLKLSSNKDLAKLAGLTPIDPGARPEQDQAPAGTSPRTGPGPSTRSLGSASSSYAFKPLITPLSSPELTSAFGTNPSLSSALPTFLGGNPSSDRPAPRAARVSPEATAMDSPGAIADRDNPAPDPAAADLTLDLLPGETRAQARDRAEANQNPHLPVLMNSDQLHAQQLAALKAPTGQPARPGQTPTQPPIAKPITPDPADEPIPVGGGATVTPVHAPIASPFDLLHR